MIATIYTTRENFLNILEKNGYTINMTVVKDSENKYMVKICKNIKEKAKLSGIYYTYTSESYFCLVDNSDSIMCEFRGRANYCTMLRNNNIKFDKF